MSFMKKLGSIVSDVIIILLIGIIIVNITFISSSDDEKLPSLFGYKFLVDLTDSMSPEINAGDMIVIKEEDAYKVNDVVSYRNKKNDIITHRIVSIVDKEYYYMGDKNKGPDVETTSIKKIEGKLIKRVKGLGTILLFLKSVYGLIFLIVLAICYIFFLIIKERYFD